MVTDVDIESIHLETVAVFISLLALILTLFNFYWSNLRHLKKLYLVRIDSLLPMMQPEFALINGGSEDILITKIDCGFEDKDGGIFYPAKRINIDHSESMLLQAAKAFHCKVVFTETFNSKFGESGHLLKGTTPPIYTKDFVIDVEWAEISGNTHSKKVKISQYGFNGGDIVMHSPLQKKHELYKGS